MIGLQVIGVWETNRKNGLACRPREAHDLSSITLVLPSRPGVFCPRPPADPVRPDDSARFGPEGYGKSAPNYSRRFPRNYTLAWAAWIRQGLGNKHASHRTLLECSAYSSRSRWRRKPVIQCGSLWLRSRTESWDSHGLNGYVRGGKMYSGWCWASTAATLGHRYLAVGWALAKFQ